MRTHTFVRGAAVAAVVAALAFGTAACGSSGSSAPAAAAGPMVTVGTGSCGISVSSTLNVKPAIVVPACVPMPTKFAVDTIVRGTGDIVNQGQNATVKYVGIAWSTKKQFDSSWDRNPQTFTVTSVGSGPVIMGWNIGLTDVRVGSRILLEVPPDMGYGPSGQGSIGPNETLLFVVDVISVN